MMDQDERSSAGRFNWLVSRWWLGLLLIGGSILFLWLSSFLIPANLSPVDLVLRTFLFLGTVGVASFLAVSFGLGKNIHLNIRRTIRIEQAVNALSNVVENLRNEKRGQINNLANKMELLRDLVGLIWKKNLPFLLPIDEMEKLEETIEEVWVFSRALDEDMKIYKKIYKNLRRGVNYIYMIPPREQGAKTEDQLDLLKKQWKALAEEDGRDSEEILSHVKKRIVNYHCFVATVIVYDHAKDPKVIVKLPSDLPEREYSLALQIKPEHKEPIENVIRCLQDLSQEKCPLMKEILAKREKESAIITRE